MNNERIRWITQPPTADRWTVSVAPTGTAGAVEGWVVMLTVYCDRKRGALYTHTETYDPDALVYSAVDYAHHVHLVMSQARPASKERFLGAMMGEQQLPL